MNVNFMSDRQLRELVKTGAMIEAAPMNYDPFPAQDRAHRSQCPITLTICGNRCLRGDQKIVTREGHVAIADIQESQLVLSYYQKANRFVWSRAGVPFVKGSDYLYRVVHEEGEFVAHGLHRIFSSEGKYERVLDLEVGDTLAISSSTIEDTDQRGLPSGGQQVTAIKSIEKLRKKEWFYDVTVEGTHNYVTSDGTTSHNSGKSQFGCMELVWRLLGTHPYKESKVPIKASVGSVDFKAGIQDVILEKLRVALPKRVIKSSHKNSQGIIDRIELINGSTVGMYSYDQPSMKWEGSDSDFWWFDEPPPRDHYIAAARGLVDRGGDALFTMTPLAEAWIHDELWIPGVKIGDHIKDDIEVEHNQRIECHNWSAYDNPHINHNELREYEKLLTPEEAATRIRGEFSELLGRVFKQFGKKQTIESYDWPARWPYIEGLDPHGSRAHAVVRIGVTPREDLVVYLADKVPGTMEQLAHAMIAGRPTGSSPMTTVADTSLNTEDQEAQVNLKDELEEHGVETEPAYKKDQLIAGLHEMNKRFGLAARGETGGLYVMDCCVDLIYELMHLQWDEKRPEKTKGKDDLTDATRYAVMRDPIGMTKEGELPEPSKIETYGHAVQPKPRPTGKEFDYGDDDEDDEPADVMSIEVRY